jgi:hypothetical protein
MLLCREWVRRGVLVHDPGDEVLTTAVLGVPARRQRHDWGAGMLALVVAWWAGKDRGHGPAAT